MDLNFSATNNVIHHEVKKTSGRYLYDVALDIKVIGKKFVYEDIAPDLFFNL